MEDHSLYTIQLEFRVSDLFKYRFINGEWKSSPRSEKISQQPIIYEHTDSPNFGHHWSKEAIAFGKLKLTNNENSKSSDAIYLKSLMKYDPIVHVFRHDKNNVDFRELVLTTPLYKTQFIAVTAYQNEAITSLKIKYNPFAKAFLNNNKPVITIENSKVIVEKKSQPLAHSSYCSELTKQETTTSYQQIDSNMVNRYTSPKEENVFANHSNLIQNWYTSRQYNQPQHAYNYGYPTNYYTNYLPQHYQPNVYASYQMPAFQYTPSTAFTPENNSQMKGSKRSYSLIESDEQYNTNVKRMSYDIKSIATNNLPPSPVFSSPETYPTRLNFNDQSSEDSDSSNTDCNFYGLYPNQVATGNNIHARSINESGYYTHSPNSIASILDSNVAIQSAE